MALSEQYYIDLCKKAIEEKFSFGNGNGYTQRDLELLSQNIEEKTGVNISLSTLKRLWKNNYKQSPQLATLNALAALLEYKDWQEFKLSNKKIKKKTPAIIVGIIIGISLVAGLLTFLGSNSHHIIEKTNVKVNGPVKFTASKTVTKGIPNTVIFNYDLSHVEADSFFIQQSWNDLDKVPIDPKGNVVSRIYYESGYHRAKLMANDSILSKQPVHILSDGWEPHVYYNGKDFIDFSDEDFIVDGTFKLNKSLLESKHVDLSEYYETRVSNSKEFNVSSDNFSFSTRFKLDSLMTSNCPWMFFLVVTEKHIFKVQLMKKGCERYANYKMGEVYRSGKDNDLSALGCNVYNWQEVTVKVINKLAEIYINNELAFTERYLEDYGDIKGFAYVFEGTGSIDYTKLLDEKGVIAFEDNFD